MYMNIFWVACANKYHNFNFLVSKFENSHTCICCYCCFLLTIHHIKAILPAKHWFQFPLKFWLTFNIQLFNLSLEAKTFKLSELLFTVTVSFDVLYFRNRNTSVFLCLNHHLRLPCDIPARLILFLCYSILQHGCVCEIQSSFHKSIFSNLK